MKDALPSNAWQFLWRYWPYILLCFSPLAIAIYKYREAFDSAALSGSQEVWAQFGDFFNFPVAISLGLANLLLLYQLTRVANRIQASSLEQQLKFELYRDFISGLDEFFRSYLSGYSGNEGAIYLGLIDSHLRSSADNFEGLLDEESMGKFRAACGTAREKAAALNKEKNPGNVTALADAISAIKGIIFQQTRISKR